MVAHVADDCFQQIGLRDHAEHFTVLINHKGERFTGTLECLKQCKHRDSFGNENSVLAHPLRHQFAALQIMRQQVAGINHADHV